MTLPSCTLLPSPSSIQSASPRSTQLNQTLDPFPNLTLPITQAPGAM